MFWGAVLDPSCRAQCRSRAPPLASLCDPFLPQWGRELGASSRLVVFGEVPPREPEAVR